MRWPKQPVDPMAPATTGRTAQAGDGSDARRAAVAAQYEAWPYPKVPLLASVRATDPWQLHVDALRDRCGAPPVAGRPRIWIAGCGTFQPYVIGVANPGADILATDISAASLRIARRRCRLHGHRRTRFQAIDLADPAAGTGAGWPEGTFDWIECYGVLMNLPDPAATLAALARRLAPGGVLRVMLYPLWSRYRIFQVQRMAKLAGLTAGGRRDPARLRSMVADLPVGPPLRRAFFQYKDSANDAGVVDAFLHAGDCGFTAARLVSIAAAAGLRPAQWFHRPWAQPRPMATALGLGDRSDPFVLDYLDIWQELRGNLVACFVAAPPGGTVAGDSADREAIAPRPHPIFQGGRGSIRQTLARWKGRLHGMRLPDRTGYGPVRVAPGDVRLLADPGALAAADPAAREDLQERGLVLGGRHPECAPAGTDRCRPEPVVTPEPPIGNPAALAGQMVAIGPESPNPFHAPLFAAWTLDRRRPELGLPSLADQLATWGDHGDPLEDTSHPVGLTPHGSWSKWGPAIEDHLEQPQGISVPWETVRLADEDRALAAVGAWLERFCPGRWSALTAAERRELWVLHSSWQSPFLHLEGPVGDANP